MVFKWSATFGKQRQALDRLLGLFEKPQCSVNATVRDVDCVGLDILNSLGTSCYWFLVRHLFDAL